jgi:type II secretory pathway predicted ATPase ExeA
LEHLHHFQLGGDPFRNEPLLRNFFENGPQQSALQRLERSVRQGKGLSVLIGETGSGKTMVVRRLLDNLEEEVFDASMMVVLDGAADAGWILRRFAKQLGVEDPKSEREGLISQIYECLAIIREDGRQAVLIIDDAQALANRGALAEICSLLKLEYEDRRLLCLVLAGPPQMDRAFRSGESLAHRIDVRVSLDSLSPDVAVDYIAHRIDQVGGPPELLDGGALAALHELGAGYPGRMNTLADNALFEAFLCGRSQMNRVDVERAYGDLGWANTAADPVDSAPETSTNADTPIDAKAAGELRETLDQIDSELETMFEPAPGAADPSAPSLGPPKDEDAEPADLLVELIED